MGAFYGIGKLWLKQKMYLFRFFSTYAWWYVIYKRMKRTKYVHLKLEFRNDALVKTQIVLLEVTNLNTLTYLSTILWFNMAILRI